MEIVEECNEEAIEKKKMMKSIPDSVDMSSLSLSEAVDSMNKTMETRELDYFFKDRTEKKFFKKSYSKKTAYYVRRMRRIRHLSIERPLSFAGPWVFTDPPATSISYIPRSVLRLKEKPVLRDESLREILSRLPVKSLMRFKCVCKRWQSLIQDHSFVDLHLTQSQRRPDLLIAVPGEDVVRFFSAEDTFEGGAAIHRIEIPSWGHGALGSINGLICFVDLLEPATCIYNLSTREKTPWIKTSVKREKIRLGFDYRQEGPVFGFGFDPATKEHKVICMWEIFRFTTKPSYELIGGTAEKICKVLTVGKNTWRRIDDVPPYMLRGRAIYANGSIYRRNAGLRFLECPEFEVIVAFDVGSEKFRSIPIPNFIVDTWDSHGKCDLRTDYLLEINGRIAIVDEITAHAVRLWICHENKEKMTSRWTENTITLPSVLDGRHLFPDAIPGTNQIVIQGDSTPRGCLPLFYYDLKKKTYKKVEITGISPSMESPQIYTFVESLLPVDKQQLHHTKLSSDDLLSMQAEVGHYNIFLNVITQGFRNEFMSSSHVHVGNPCAVCALYDAFTALNKASINTPIEVDAASAPTCWRITATDFYPYINYFRECQYLF
ncbi:F-box domain [Macleaya cordata]|uniref:F-box domain n=1 Tax=Macleaya cordata TaxID=56857 RepID=A0A200Q469_MACCD|nr:F-box domain [Macleaya cordata]